MTRVDRFLLALAGFCSVLFLVGYAVATSLYPGGNLFDRRAVGFDLADNYLCDAFRARAYDGSANPVGASVGQLAMIALVVAASSVLFASPSIFRAELPRVARTTRVLAAVAFVGMMLVPLTPAHEYGRLHFAAVGIAAIPSLAAMHLVVFGLLRAVRGDDLASRVLRTLGIVTAVAGTLHFGQYLAQVVGILGISPWVPRVQKPVVLLVVAWIASLVVWARTHEDERISGERLARAETLPPERPL